MSLIEVTVEGTVLSNGTLEFDRKPNLLPGRVTAVLRQESPPVQEADDFWLMMNEIWAEQKARGHIPRTVEEVEAERRQVREESEIRQTALEQLQEECGRLRGQMP